MPRYFFDIETDDRMLQDVLGAELPNREAVKTAAERTAREFIDGRSLSGESNGVEILHVRDENGERVLSFPCLATP